MSNWQPIETALRFDQGSFLERKELVPLLAVREGRGSQFYALVLWSEFYGDWIDYDTWNPDPEHPVVLWQDVEALPPTQP